MYIHSAILSSKGDGNCSKGPISLFETGAHLIFVCYNENLSHCEYDIINYCNMQLFDSLHEFTSHEGRSIITSVRQ